MKFLFGNILLINISFIFCFIFAFFVNCSGIDTPVEEFASQIEDGQETNNSDNNSGEITEENSNNNNNNNNDDDNDNNDNNHFTERSESAPILKHIVDRIAEQCPEQVQALSDGQNWTGNLDFLDLLVEALREEDTRWGYSFWDGHIWSSDMIGYYRGTGDPHGSNDILILDYINKTAGPYVHWSIATYESLKAEFPNSEGEWRYPRPGTTVSLSDCTGNVDNNNNNLVSCGSAASLAGYGGYGPDGQAGTSDDPHIYSTSATSCEDLEVLSHNDWKDFTFQDSSSSTPQSNDQISEVVQSGGICCVRETGTTTTPPTTHSPTTELGQCDISNEFAVLQQVAAAHPDLLRNSNNCPPHYRDGGTYEFLEAVLVELRKKDTRWGYYHRTQHNLQHASSDAIAYYCDDGDGNGSSDLRFVDVITSSCQISWQDSKEGHAARARPENGYWKYPR